ncbi:phospholipase D-like domain-containing protein [Sphingomonas sp. KR1UV-12]|uniref:Phospholipase D n=1 Tax=Sphingomonas aurea TaxID=3063994 RepID=A0ABT9EI39_9SPHN|nr:phospholipase D-like domain-containing protein [Sphingomonas sp. KR1UV-12]MDP1026584.1 phospholipase D-like domain-containing protein [Sphingomonas sp. KR1UV-12]
MEPGDEFWRVARADRMSVIIDADDYFRVARRAMLQAKRRILLIGWDFDARIVLDHDAAPGEGVGRFIYDLVRHNPALEVFLLRWDLGALKSLGRGSTIFTVLKWMAHPRIHTKLDGHHPTGASHHQKIVIIDDCLAFCGGIDMTGDRWDTRAHLDEQPLRRRPLGQPYKPWHDAITALQGPIAHQLGILFRERWRAAGGKDALLPAADSPGESCWPDGLPVDFEGIDVGIARTLPEMPDQPGVHESEALFLAQIAAARESLYIESQYFASRRIAEAIARRLDAADGPEIVIINPVTAQGWLEPLAMDTARARLMTALRQRDQHGRLRMYHPHTAGGTAIYCHAKILIADGRVLRLGSSNVNNRSLRLDTECDVSITADTDAEVACVVAIRDGLIAEHLGVDAPTVQAAVARTGSLIATIEELRGSGKTLRPYEVPDLSAVEAWLADNEVLDPEGPEEMFEPLSKRGLFRRLSLRGRSKR